jgi:hypothetical protein
MPHRDADRELDYAEAVYNSRTGMAGRGDEGDGRSHTVVRQKYVARSG